MEMNNPSLNTITIKKQLFIALIPFAGIIGAICIYNYYHITRDNSKTIKYILFTGAWTFLIWIPLAFLLNWLDGQDNANIWIPICVAVGQILASYIMIAIESRILKRFKIDSIET